MASYSAATLQPRLLDMLEIFLERAIAKTGPDFRLSHGHGNYTKKLDGQQLPAGFPSPEKQTAQIALAVRLGKECHGQGSPHPRRSVHRYGPNRIIDVQLNQKLFAKQGKHCSDKSNKHRNDRRDDVAASAAGHQRSYDLGSIRKPAAQTQMVNPPKHLLDFPAALKQV